MNLLLILLGKIVLFLSKTFNLGSGSTWPGHIAMETNSQFVKQIFELNPKIMVILVAGTNGKTTTSLMLQAIIEESGLRVFRNEAGANLLNGIASSVIKNANLTGRLNFDVAIFEVDERNVSLTLKEIKPYAILILNIFRDQLDRYGEVNHVLSDWSSSLLNLESSTVLVTNGDDPALSYIAQKSNLDVSFFGINTEQMSGNIQGHDVDFIYCPNCQNKLNYKKVSFSHMGDFACLKCKFARPVITQVKINHYPLFGTYNIYNANAAALLANRALGISVDTINDAFKHVSPAFGRQEEISYKGRLILMLLSKNPAGFNQSIDAIRTLNKNGNILIALNDRIPDGRDVSWIWDVDFENLPNNSKIFITGDRAYDMALRIKYLDNKAQVFESLDKAIETATSETSKSDTLYILPTYSAMLDARKILTGKKIL